MGGMTLLEVATDRRTSLPGRTVSRLAFSPDGRFLASGSGITLWEMPAGVPLTSRQPPPPGTLLAFAPDGQTLATVHSVYAPRRRTEHTIRLSETVSGAERRTLRGPGDFPTGLAFSPNGRLLAAACGQFLWVWEPATGEVVWRHKIDRRHFEAVAFTPDGRFLVASHNDPTVRLWEVGTWRQQAAYDWKIGLVRSLAMARDGMRAAAGGRIAVWDLDVE
jgi:WD40 repeat protein